ncbi:cupin domain-containing protein [Rhizobium bangladeshense]|uniref:cupin domain-containing protein n=1 Tax=Rhizobium bangladeshense TaxID=1138189 RepID=UPI001C82A66E|nr:cupin domain-containing protein [Rhizobium bangladeshense]
MEFQRIITGNDTSGKAVFLDTLVTPQTSAFVHVPGFIVSTLWSTSEKATIPHTVNDPVPSVTSLVPAPGETRFVKVTFPPDSSLESITNWEAVGVEYSSKLPGLAEKFEADSPGMHTTPTVDYIIVLSGELWLELDAGEQRYLKAGDVVVQNGTRHAWRNRSANPATILSVMIGATYGGR